MQHRRSKPLRTLFWAVTGFVLIMQTSSSCASSDSSDCDFNSDCDHAYCSNGKCKQDCIDAARDCPEGYQCNVNGQCEFGAGGAGGDSSGSGGTLSIAGTNAAGGANGGSIGVSGGNSGVGGIAAGAAGVGNNAGATNGGSNNGGSNNNAGTGGLAAGGASAGHAGNPIATGGAGGVAGTSSGNGGVSSAGKAGNSPFGGGGQPMGTGGATVATKTELDICASDDECIKPFICRADFKNGPMRCTRTCASLVDCYGGRRCEEVAGNNVCVGGDIGRICTAANDCNFACLTSQGYCTSKCTTGADCPSGYGCEAVGTPAVSVCVMVEAPCDSGDTSACIASSACDMTILVSGCTIACDSVSDCPVRADGFPPWTCDGLCRRPSDVNGPLPGGTNPAQYACNAQSTVVNVCNDAQHIDFDAFTIPNPPAVSCAATMTTDGVAGDSCVDTCRYEGGCPFGFSCIGVGSVGSSRIGLCFPYGSGVTGSSCQSASECEFGYCTSTNVCTRDCTEDGICPTGTTCTPGGGPTIEGKAFSKCL